ncbi:DHA2 family efflux MFS transporter permease subunit [Bacillus ginsengihumi]|uniref:MFS transporter n=1 Tax=Heyndrickxia ginsengihumi TaxID=363870 RepID=A0A0A6VI25_9BACI|nr:DHA2 family efflux MFS transporter permease subunit [Heyndrickxia ginsengihumi]KHD86274.1 MFS transporter [Heyndrickxia ginsengihumi]MBE6184970.1 DHA2 family efflux MFS transporter permease subunit [Bacillus sp. (in: firmicutes)]MCM3024700.1 DHA2 family efflux MFS transporter permease subunit [Heyndrickxia ginsengihumi]NEY21587.1 DHA2 family efflux MFS transporter permease subunit [Heyndrickxia ginsengihumi]
MSISKVSNQAIRTTPIFAVLLAGAFVAFLNQTVINVALPKIMNYFDISAVTANWLSTIFMLTNGIVIPITAFLMERFTTRQLFLFSIGIFAVGTFICATAFSFPIMLVGRVVQAIGAGILFPLITNVIFTIFPIERRGFAMGIFGVAMNFAPAVGPTWAGWIIETYSWRVIFYIIGPIALIDFIIAIFLVKNVTETSRPKLDTLGIILSTIGFGGLLYGFSTGGSKGWSDPEVITLFIIGGVSLILFVWRQLTVKHPILEFRIFKYRMFTLTTIINVIVTMAMFSGMILMPIYMQNVRGFSPLEAGFMLLPGGIVMGVMSPITGRLFDKYGAKWLAIIGLAITIITTFALTRLHTDTPFAYVLWVYTARMFGMSILMMPIFTAGLNDLGLGLNKYGTAMVNTFRMVAGAVGMAFFVSVMTNQGASHVKTIISEHHILPTDKAHMALAVNQGTVMGINDAFMIATYLTIIAFILSFFIRGTKPSNEETVPNTEKELKKVPQPQ